MGISATLGWKVDLIEGIMKSREQRVVENEIVRAF